MVMLGARLLVLICVIFSLLLMLLFLHLSSELSEIQTYVLNKGGTFGRHLPDESDVDSNTIVIYNRVPKTGSTSFIGLAYSLCAKNNINVIHINTTKNSPTLTMTDQVKFARNITYWYEKKPAIYHGHIAFLDIKRLGPYENPLYINILRRPIDRLISYFYFLRYGDDLRPQLVRKRQGNKMTFDECVEAQHADCSVQRLWIQVPYFCGHFSECWTPGSEWALEQAKHNLVHSYFLVGVTEEMEEFVALLDYTLPRFFRGSLKLYVEGKRSHLRKTNKKILPTAETIEKLKSSKVWQLEEEFYNFALDHFHFIKSKTIVTDEVTGNLIPRPSNFKYEKIKPSPPIISKIYP